jgi:GAF domain-containing protein
MTPNDGKRLDAARASAAARAERLLRVTAAIADAVTAEQVFAAVVDQVAFALEATTAALWLLNDDGNVGLARSRGYSTDVVRALETLQLEQVPSLPALDAIRLAEPIWIESQERLLERYPHLGAVVSAEGGYRVAALPLVADGRVLGALGLSISNELEPSDDEHDLLLLVARYASQAVGRLELLEAERKSRAAANAAARRLEQLYQFAQAAAATDRIDVVHEAALAAIERALGTDRASILVLDSDRVMRFKAWHGLSPDYRAAVDGHSPWAHDAVDPAARPRSRCGRRANPGHLRRPLPSRGDPGARNSCRSSRAAGCSESSWSTTRSRTPSCRTRSSSRRRSRTISRR